MKNRANNKNKKNKRNNTNNTNSTSKKNNTSIRAKLKQPFFLKILQSMELLYFQVAQNLAKNKKKKN